MSLTKDYNGYKSFDYLDGDDYEGYKSVDEVERVERYLVPLTDEEEERVKEIVGNSVMISAHEHVDVKPADIRQMPAVTKQGRMNTAFEGLSHSYWDAVFDNLMDGHCTIHSKSGWKWTEVLHDLGMRLSDIAHQDFLIHALSVDDILRAHEEKKIAWIVSIEGAAMIENELDRIEILYGFGVRSLGVTYSEANALGSGLKEDRDGGLTTFGREAVERMNKVGMLIDCSHAGDQTALDTIECSCKPVVMHHIGAKGLWGSKRMAPDEVLIACAEKGGLIGVEAAPHTTLTKNHPEHNLESVMEHFEYIKDLVGIDHVTFGPDTIFGDHVGSHHVYASELSIAAATNPVGNTGEGSGYEPVEYVKGIENPIEGSRNIVRWLVKHNYSDEEIEKVIGKNTLRVLKEVWHG